jgi:hypothetical protein
MRTLILSAVPAQLSKNGAGAVLNFEKKGLYLATNKCKIESYMGHYFLEFAERNG